MMKFKIILTLFLVNFSYTVRGQDTDTSSGENDFYYPCQLQSDISCIREYFASTGLCSRVSHQDGQPIHDGPHQYYEYNPSANYSTSATDVDLIFYGTEVKSFYVNRQTNNLVLSVNFDGINMNMAVMKFIIDQRGKEPMVFEDPIRANFSAELTAIIPSGGLIGLRGSAVNSYITNAVPPFELGPNFSESSDPVVSAAYKGFIEDVPRGIEELFLTKGPHYFYIYLQNYICDFGFEFSGKIV